MNKYVQNFWVRFFAVLLCSIAVVTAIGAGILTVGIAAIGDKEQVYENVQEILAENYAAYIYDHIYEGEENSDKDIALIEKFLKDKNFTCSVGKKKGRDTGAEALEKEEIFLYDNLEDASDWDYEFSIIDGSSVSYNVEDALDALRISPLSQNGLWMTSDVITGYYFEEATGLFYYKAGTQYFLADYIMVSQDGVYYDYRIKNTEKGEKVYYNSYYGITLDASNYRVWDWVEMNGQRLLLAIDDIEVLNEIAIVTNDSIQRNLYTGVYFEYGENCIDYYPERSEDVYIIRVKADDLTHTENVSEDMFLQWKRLWNNIYANEVSCQVILGFSVLGFLLGMALLIYSANNDKENMGFLQKIPVGMFSVCIMGLEILLSVLMVEVVIGEFSGYVVLSFDLWLIIAIFTIFVMAFLAMILIQNIVARVKTRTFIRYSELHYALKVFKWCWSKWKCIWHKMTAPIKFVVNFARENTKLFIKGFIVMSIIAFAEFMVFVLFRYDTDMFILLFLFEKAVEFVIAAYILLQMQKLQEGSRYIAAGDLSHPINTGRMLWEFKKHGENINKVSDGIALAVEERMKSERFKTELITNVSHDIKTPLTSIINYVDLIKKQDVQDETLQEYVDVLDRQSARLKKLIEDLMEASKASTGNLTVNMEDCDIEVLLTQIIGEFEEKLAANQLEVVVQKPEHPVIVLADGRHMWRVLDNLLNNACKYSLSGTRVYISLVHTENEVSITFKNISKAALNIPSEELLERFVRGDSSRNTEGSGLGLSIAQSLTELMNGKMKLEIDGDLFKVTLRFQAIDR